MTRPGARREWSGLKHLSGVRALADGGVCELCDRHVLKDQRIVKAGERWVHAECWKLGHE